MATADVHLKSVVLLLLIHCFCKTNVLCFYVMSLICCAVVISSLAGEERELVALLLLPSAVMRLLVFCAVGWSAIL